MDHGAHRSRIDALASRTQEGRRAGRSAHERAPALVQPRGQRALGGHTEGHRALATALAQDAKGATRAIDVVDIQTNEFAHPDPCGVERLEDGEVAQSDG